MTVLQAIILGLVEGLTEFLPVSSTAHLLLAQRLMDITLTQSMVTFTIAVQLGSILAAFFLYRKKFASLSHNVVLCVALVPTLVAGVFVYPHLKTIFSHILFIVPWTLIVGGLLMLVAEYVYKKKRTPESEPELTAYQKIYLGCAQTLALVPGVSRSASMIVAGLFAGLPRNSLSSFTFILAVPTMFAATTYDVYKNVELVKHDVFSVSFFVGFTVAFLAAFLSIRFMLYVVRRYTFVPFGWYRVILGLGIILFLYI